MSLDLILGAVLGAGLALGGAAVVLVTVGLAAYTLRPPPVVLWTPPPAPLLRVAPPAPWTPAPPPPTWRPPGPVPTTYSTAATLGYDLDELPGPTEIGSLVETTAHGSTAWYPIPRPSWATGDRA